MTSPAEEEELDYDEDIGDQFLDDMPLEEVDCDYDEEDAEADDNKVSEDARDGESAGEANSDDEGEAGEGSGASEDEESERPAVEENSDVDEERESAEEVASAANEDETSDDEVNGGEEEEGAEAGSGNEEDEKRYEDGEAETAGSSDDDHQAYCGSDYVPDENRASGEEFGKEPQAEQYEYATTSQYERHGGSREDESAEEPRRKRRRKREDERNRQQRRESTSLDSEEEKKRRRAERFGLDGSHAARDSSGSTSSHRQVCGRYEKFASRGGPQRSPNRFSHVSSREHQSSSARGSLCGSYAKRQTPLAKRIGFDSRGKAPMRGKNASAQNRPPYGNPYDRPAVRPHPGLLPLPSASPQSPCSERADGCESPTYGRRGSRARRGSRSRSREERDPRDSRPPVPARSAQPRIQLARRGTARKLRYQGSRTTAQQDVEGPRSPSPQLRDVTPVPEALTVDTRQAKHVVAGSSECSVKKQKSARIGAGFKPTLPPVAPSEAHAAAVVPPSTSTNVTSDQPHASSSFHSAHADQTVTTRNDLREPLSVFSRQRNLTSTAVLEPSEDSTWSLRPIDLSDFVVYSCRAEKPAERPFLHRSEKRIPLVNPASLTIDKAKDSLLKEFELAQWERHEMQVKTANYDALKDEIVRLEGEVASSSRKNQQLQKELADADLNKKAQKDLVEASVQLRATLKDDLETKDSLLKAEKAKTTELSKELEEQRAAYKELEKKLEHSTRASSGEVDTQTDRVDDDDIREVHYEVPPNVTTELNDLRRNLATVTSERHRLSKKLEEQKTEHESELGTANKAIADLQKQILDKECELRAGLSASAVLKQKLSEGQRDVGALTKVLKSRGQMLRRRVCLRCAPKRQRKKKSDRIELAQQQQMLVTLDQIISQVRSQNAPQATLVAAAPENSDVQHMVAAVQHGHRQISELLGAASRSDAPSSSGSADVAPSTSATVADRVDPPVPVRPVKREPFGNNEPPQPARKSSSLQSSGTTSSTSSGPVHATTSAHPNPVATSESDKRSTGVSSRSSSDRNSSKAGHVSMATVNSGGIGIANPRETSSVSTSTITGGASRSVISVNAATCRPSQSGATSSPIKRQAKPNAQPARTSATFSSVQRPAPTSSSSSVATCTPTTDPSSRASIVALKERLAALATSRISSDANSSPTDVARTAASVLRTVSYKPQPSTTARTSSDANVSPSAVARTAASASRTVSSDSQPSTSASVTARTSSDANVSPAAAARTTANVSRTLSSDSQPSTSASAASSTAPPRKIANSARTNSDANVSPAPAARTSASVSRTLLSDSQPSTSASSASTTVPPRRTAHSAAALSSQRQGHSSALPAAERRNEQSHHKPSSSPSTFDRVGRAITDLSGNNRRPPTSDPRFGRLRLGAILPSDFEAAIYFLRARDARSPLSEDEIGRCFVGMFKNAAAAGSVWAADSKAVVDLVKHP